MAQQQGIDAIEVEIGDGSSEYMPLTPAGQNAGDRVAFDHHENLALVVAGGDLDGLAMKLMMQITDDERAVEKRDQEIARYIKLLGVGEEPEPDDLEDEEASTATHPLLIEAMVQFQSESLQETYPVGGPFRAEAAFDVAQVPEQNREELRERMDAAIDRVTRFFNHYVERHLPDWDRVHEDAIQDMGLNGSGFKKVYVDASSYAPIRIDLVRTEDLVFARGATTRAGRVTQKCRLRRGEILRRMRVGEYRSDVHLPERTAVVARTGAAKARDDVQGVELTSDDIDPEFLIYEAHVDLTLDVDPHPRGLPRPYIVTILADTYEILSVQRNWRDSDLDERRRVFFVDYNFMPGFGTTYPIGLGGLLANQTQSLQRGLREAYRAAFLANLPSGFFNGGMELDSGPVKFKAGVFQPINANNAAGGDIGKAVSPLPFKGADPSLLELDNRSEERAQRLAGTTMTKVDEIASANTPVGTILAAIDEATKPKSAVHRRLYSAMARECDLLLEAAKDFWGREPVTIAPGITLHPGDLYLVRLAPTMRPGSVNRTRRIMEAQAKLEMAQKFPQMHDLREALIDYYRAISVTGDDLERVLPEPEEAQPADPVTEHGRALRGEALRAGPAQAHGAHIDAHMASVKSLEQQAANNQQAAQGIGLLMSHIADHLALEMATQVASAMGLDFRQLQQGLPPDLEAQIAPEVARAMQAVAARAMGEAEEPLEVTIEKLRQETKLKAEEMERQTKIAIEVMERELEREKMEHETAINDADNSTALEIAAIRESGVPDTDVTAPTQDRDQNQDQNPRG